jgi:hypothetical protein
MSLEKIKQLRPAEHLYTDTTKGDTKRLTMSVMAQNINQVWPIEKYSILNKDSNGYFTVEVQQLITPMIKAIQELSEEIERLKNDRIQDN